MFTEFFVCGDGWSGTWTEYETLIQGNSYPFTLSYRDKDGNYCWNNFRSAVEGEQFMDELDKEMSEQLESLIGDHPLNAAYAIAELQAEMLMEGNDSSHEQK